MWTGMLSDTAYITQEYLQLRWIRVPEKPGDYGVVIVLIQWEHGNEVGCYVSLQRHTERRRLTETGNKCVFVAHTFYTFVGRRWSSCKDNLKDKQLNVKGPLSRKQRSWDEHTHTHLHTYVVTHSCEAAPGLLGNRIDGTQGHGVIVEMFVCICTISAAKHLQQWGIVKWQLTTELQHVYADYTFFFF